MSTFRRLTHCAILLNLNNRAYEYLSQINALRDPFEPYLGGNLVADVAIYFDKKSLYDPEVNGLTPAKALAKVNLPHRDAMIGVARILREAHIPFGMVTNITLDQLSQYRAVILPNVTEMTTAEAEVFRTFVRNGGILYASGTSSLTSPDARERRFLLSDVLGVDYDGFLREKTIYLSSNDPEIVSAIWPQENLEFSGPALKTKLRTDAHVLASIKLPFVDPNAGNAFNSQFAQIWSNPPASSPTGDPGIVVNDFGKGKTVWSSLPIETRSNAINAKIFELLLKRILKAPLSFESDTERTVEMTLFSQPDKRRLLVSLLNLQEEFPTIPVSATVRVLLPAGRYPEQVLLLPEEKAVEFSQTGQYISFHVLPFKLVSMLLVNYR